MLSHTWHIKKKIKQLAYRYRGQTVVARGGV